MSVVDLIRMKTRPLDPPALMDLYQVEKTQIFIEEQKVKQIETVISQYN